jgi:hypothetical protein
MKKTLILTGCWLFIAVAAVGQARFVYGTGVDWSFEEASYRSISLEDALLLYTYDKFKVVASVLYAGYTNAGNFETFIVRDPAWAFSSTNVGPMLFMELKGKLDGRYTELFKQTAEKRYSGILAVLYIRRKMVRDEGDAAMNSEFIIDAIRFPFALVQ